ncbi:hypothetical protein ACIBO6_02110 [Streptomyces luteogriseus]
MTTATQYGATHTEPETQECGHRTLARLRSQGRNGRTTSNGGTRA